MSPSADRRGRGDLETFKGPFFEQRDDDVVRLYLASHMPGLLKKGLDKDYKDNLY